MGELLAPALAGKSLQTPRPRAKISSVWRGMQTSMSVSGRRE